MTEQSVRRILRERADRLIFEHPYHNARQFAADLIDDIVEAGVRAPARVIKDAVELDTLPIGSVVLDNFAAGCTRVHPDPVFGWVRATDAHPDRRHFHPPFLPARVLFDPTQEGQADA